MSEEKISNKNLESKQLTLIPKIEDYIEYVLNVITKLPRTEKFSIGNEYKKSMYEILENSLYMAKVNNSEDKKEILKTLNYIDSKLTCQRIYLRIMKKQKWIDENKYKQNIRNRENSRRFNKILCQKLLEMNLIKS